MDRLHILYQDTATLDEFKNLFLDVLAQETVERAFNREDIGGIADAKELLEKVFERLDELYKPKKVRKQPSSK
jgi:hypothetical protein